MVAGTYAESDTGETLRLDIGLELGAALKQKSFTSPSWRQNFHTENKDKQDV